MIKYENYTLDNIEIISKEIINNLSEKIIILKGNLGSGKTTLVSYIIKMFDSLERVSSPTYSIVNQYDTNKGKIYHFDLYRIKNIEELQNIGFSEYLYSGNYCFIEWPEIIEPFIDIPYITINIDNIQNKRTITVH